MTARFGRCRMWWMFGLLGLAPFLLAPRPAFGIFPPVIHKPTTPTVTGIATVPSDPPIVIQGDPSPPPVTHPTANTPEPATLVTGLIGLAFGRFLIRRKKV